MDSVHFPRQSALAPATAPKSGVAGKRYALYARKSTEEDERQCQSIESQKSRVTEMADREGIRITHVLPESHSAKEPGRPEFNRLLSLIDAGEIDGVVAWHPDRLARNEIDAAALTFRLRKGVLKDLKFVEFLFHNSPEGILMLQSSLSQSQYQVSKLAVDVKRGIDDKIRLGWYPHRAPLGYLNDTHLFKGRKSISPDPDRFPLVRRAWDLLLTGAYSVPQIGAIMNDEWGFRTPVSLRSGQGGWPISKTTLYRTFENVFYTGMFQHGGKIYQGSHAPMVTMDEFERAQAILGRVVKGGGKTQPLNAPRTWDRPYVGLIRCGYCGSQITSTTTVKPSGKQYVYYHCCRGLGACGKRGLREDVVEAMIDRELALLDVPPEMHEWAREDIMANSEADQAVIRKMIEQRQRAIQETTKMLDGLLNLAARGLLPEDEYGSKRNELVLKKAKLMQEAQEIYATEERVRRICLNVDSYTENARLWLKDGSTAMKRVVARNLGSDYVMKDRNIVLEPHPMLSRLRSVVGALAARFYAIKLGDFGSYSTQEEALMALRFAWSGTWDAILTDVRASNTEFPDVQAQLTSGQIPTVRRGTY